MGCSYSDRTAYKATRAFVRDYSLEHGPLTAERIETLAQSFLKDGYPKSAFDMADFVGALIYWQGGGDINL